jgi:hypothetical protein
LTVDSYLFTFRILFFITAMHNLFLQYVQESAKQNIVFVHFWVPLVSLTAVSQSSNQRFLPLKGRKTQYFVYFDQQKAPGEEGVLKNAGLISA